MVPRKIYLIPGLGADQRIFKNWDVPGYDLICLNHIEAKKGETIHEYASRFSEGIEDEQPTLVGISLGGMIALEIARLKKVRHLILISTLTGPHELPWYFKLSRYVKVHKLISGKMWKLLARQTFPRLTKRTPDSMNDFLDMIENASPEFIEWAVDAVLKWEQGALPDSHSRFHGDKDLLFPVRFTKSNLVKVPKGSHIMAITRHRLFSEELAKIVENLH